MPDGLKRLVVVSYYIEPDPYVGAMRATSFARNMPAHGWQVRVVTAASKTDVRLDCVTIAPARPYPTNFVTYLPTHDLGKRWIGPLYEGLLKLVSDWQPDVILFTGNPFLQFEIARRLSGRVPASIVLDFRDPFANNSRAKSGIGNLIKKVLERRWIRSADLVLVPNQAMAKLLATPPKRLEVIENGYDAELLAQVRASATQFELDKDCFNIVYAGTFTEDRSPIQILECIHRLSEQGIRVQLVHAGRIAGTLELLTAKYRGKVYQPLGVLANLDALRLINSADAALVVGTGATFESTTKLYEYAGLEKKVILSNISRASPAYLLAQEYGCYVELSKDSKKSELALRELIEQKKNSCLPKCRRERFSRQYQETKLAQALNALVTRK